MFPVAFNFEKLTIAVIGNSEITEKRVRQLQLCGANNLMVFSENPCDTLKEIAGELLINHLPSEQEIKKADIAMIVDLEKEQYEPLAKMIKENNVLLNIEDVKEYCDFYFTSFIKRGDLTIAVGTNGKSPALAVRIKTMLEKIFPSYWGNWLNEVADKRLEWKKQGLNFAQISERTNEYLDKRLKD